VNASVLENLNAAVVIPQAKLSPESLLWTARNLLMHGAYAEIEKNIKAVMPGNSSENFAEVVIDVINK
jgi:UDP-N-acetylglucosamine:LPS N-acetylglucosamine transferase